MENQQKMYIFNDIKISQRMLSIFHKKGDCDLHNEACDLLFQLYGQVFSFAKIKNHQYQPNWRRIEESSLKYAYKQNPQVNEKNMFISSMRRIVNDIMEPKE